MADSRELLRGYQEADQRYRQENQRYFPVSTVGTERPPLETVTEAVLIHLRELGDLAEEARQAWLNALHGEIRRH